LRHISDTGALGQVIDQVLAANPKQVEQYRAGKTTVFGFLMGQIMKATRGQANPAAQGEAGIGASGKLGIECTVPVFKKLLPLRRGIRHSESGKKVM
jgi:F420-0:gamma-glutamyl ligase-like protein